MEDAIKEVLKSKGWQGIKLILEEEIENNLKEISVEQTDKAIAIQYIGKKEAEKIIRIVIKKLERIAHEVEVVKTSYK